MGLAPLDRLIILIFMTGHQKYEFAEGKFLVLDCQEDGIEFISSCLTFFGGTVEGRELISEGGIFFPAF